jgi:hypothetical protein
VAREEESAVTDNILKLAQQARTNAQLLSISQGGIRSLTREEATKTRGEITEAIRRLQMFEKDLAKKLDT